MRKDVGVRLGVWPSEQRYLKLSHPSDSFSVRSKYRGIGSANNCSMGRYYSSGEKLVGG